MRGALEGRGLRPQVFFLEARDEILIRRFSETRHRHPLADQRGIASSIAEERRRLEPIRDEADVVIDTSDLPLRELREKVFAHLADSPDPDRLAIQLISFGFKYGLPLEADLVFDVRFMQNPYYIDELRALSGLTPEVRSFVLGQPTTERFLAYLHEFLRSSSRPTSARARPGSRSGSAARAGSIARSRSPRSWPPGCASRTSAPWPSSIASSSEPDAMTERHRRRASAHEIRRWLTPGIGVKRWLVVVFLGELGLAFGLAFVLRQVYRDVELGEPIQTIVSTVTLQSLPYGLRALILTTIGVAVFAFASWKVIRVLMDPFRSDDEDRPLVEVIYQKRFLARGPRVVALGGGTGLSTLLRGLKEHTSNLTAVVTVADDGGSSGKLRTQLGLPPVGDIRNCIVALADAEPLMGRLLQYRFPGDDDDDGPDGLGGHAIGNLLIAAMTAVEDGDFEEGVRQMNRVLAVRGQVVPASPTPLVLHASLQDGTEVVGQSKIGATTGIERVWLAPAGVAASADAVAAIAEADLLVIGPGSLFTSVLPALLLPEIRAPSLPRMRPGSTSATWRPSRARRPASTSPITSRRSSGTRRAASSTSSWPTIGRWPAGRRPSRRPARSATRSGCAGRRAWSGRPGSCSTTSSTPTSHTITTRPGLPPRSSGSPSATAPLGDAAERWRGRRDRADRRAVRPDNGAMSDADRDLVSAIRAELASIVPQRACDRAAESAGLGAALATREPTVARLAVRLGREPTEAGHLLAGRRRTKHVRVTEAEVGGVPFDWDAVADHCRIAWLRGRFLARGSLSLASGRAHLEFVVPPGEAAILARRLDELGMPASWRIRRGRGVVTWKSADTIGTFLRRVGAGSSILELENRQVARALRGDINRVINAESANLQRAVVAAARQLRAIELLEADGRLAEQPAVVRRVADARRATPEATYAELAERLDLHRSTVQRALERLERLAEDEGRRPRLGSGMIRR